MASRSLSHSPVHPFPKSRIRCGVCLSPPRREADSEPAFRAARRAGDPHLDERLGANRLPNPNPPHESSPIRSVRKSRRLANDRLGRSAVISPRSSGLSLREDQTVCGTAIASFESGPIRAARSTVRSLVEDRQKRTVAMSLAEYHRKRDFRKTAEPEGAICRSAHFHFGNLRDRLGRLRTDPWEEFGTVRQSIMAKMKRQVGLTSSPES